MEIARKTLKKKVLKMVDDSQTIKGMLGDAFGKSHQTIQRWIDNKDEMLTTIDALNIIQQQTGLELNEIIE